MIAPPLAVAEPVLNDKDPLSPVPSLAAPVRRIILPLIPPTPASVEPAGAVRTLILPLLVAVLTPDFSVRVPPAAVVEEPAVTTTYPPGVPVAEPATREMPPATPSVASPVVSEMAPVSADDDPELNSTFPERACDGVDKETKPLVVAAPERMLAVAAAVPPARARMCPPTPHEPSPTDKLICPPGPPVAVPVEPKIEPLVLVALVPVDK